MAAVAVFANGLLRHRPSKSYYHGLQLGDLATSQAPVRGTLHLCVDSVSCGPARVYEC